MALSLWCMTVVNYQNCPSNSITTLAKITETAIFKI